MIKYYNQERPGSIVSVADVVVRHRMDSWEKGTWVQSGYKEIHPTPPNPNMYRGRSVVSIPTAMEVVQDDCQHQGVNGGVHRGNGNKLNLKHPQDGQWYRKNANHNGGKSE